MNDRVAASLVKPVPARVWATKMVSSPTPKPAISLETMAEYDQLPALSTVVVAPKSGAVPLSKERLMVAPTTPVPVIKKPEPPSLASTLSSPVIASIVGSGT